MLYIGSTTLTLKHRLSCHKSNYKRYLDGDYRYTTSFKIIENNDYYIKLIEEFNYNTKQEITDKESAYIRENECINKNIPNRTQKEWCDDNKEYNKEYHKKYHQENKEKNNERNRKYRLYKTEIKRILSIDVNYFNY